MMPSNLTLSLHSLATGTCLACTTKSPRSLMHALAMMGPYPLGIWRERQSLHSSLGPCILLVSGGGERSIPLLTSAIILSAANFSATNPSITISCRLVAARRLGRAWLRFSPHSCARGAGKRHTCLHVTATTMP
jgi:hypothetical protein